VFRMGGYKFGGVEMKKLKDIIEYLIGAIILLGIIIGSLYISFKDSGVSFSVWYSGVITMVALVEGFIILLYNMR